MAQPIANRPEVERWLAVALGELEPVTLPTWPWRGERHWRTATRSRPSRRAEHPLLGAGPVVTSSTGQRYCQVAVGQTMLDPIRALIVGEEA